MDHSCSYCGGEEVVLISGKDYCQRCLYHYDTPQIVKMIGHYMATPLIVVEFLKWAFGTVHPTFSMFPLAYGKVKREEWLEEERRFETSQETWINALFTKFISGRR